MIFLVDLNVHDGSSAYNLYISTDGYITNASDTPANQYYNPRLRSVGSVEQHMFSSGTGLSGGTTRGQSQVGFGSLSVTNGRPYDGIETLDDWVELAFRSITIRSLETNDQLLSAAVTRFVGTVEQLVSTNILESYELNIKDRLIDLDKPLLLNTYGGTTTSGGLFTADGGPDLAGNKKPKIWGVKNNAPCVFVNIYDLIYQVNDGVVVSIAVFDGGIPLTNSGNFDSIALMMAASCFPGEYVTCLALGLFRLGSVAFGMVTANVVEGTTAANRTIAQITKRMLEWMSAMYPTVPVAVTPAAVTAFDVLNSAVCGIMVTGDENCLSAVSRMLNSSSGWILPSLGSTTLFDIGRFGPPITAPVESYLIEECIGNPQRIETGDDGRGVPSWKVTVRYDQLGVVQESDGLFGAVPDATRTYLATEYRSTNPAQNNSVLTQYPNAPEIIADTCFVNAVDANMEAARLLALYSVRRDIYRIKLPLPTEDQADPGIGEVVALGSTDGRIGLGSSPSFVVIGRIDNFDEPSMTLDLFK